MPPLQGSAGDFIGALAASGYMFAAGVRHAGDRGAMLLLGVYVPLALTLLAPVVVNIFLFTCFSPEMVCLWP